jgi:adenosine deaminase
MAFIAKSVIECSIPLVELHRHLDGNIRLQTILELGRQHNIPLPDWEVESLRPHVQVTDPQPGVMDFIAKFRWPMAVLVDAAACRRLAYENVEDAKHDGLDYIELRFSPLFMAKANGLDLPPVVEAVVDGIAAGVLDFGVKVNLIGILSRTYGPDTARKELEALLSYRERITALDLAGDEAHFPAEWFREHFRRARDAGWHVTAHAGEIAGPESIWHAIRDLGAERIGHAIRAVEDPALMDYLAGHHIGIESCLTSNVQTSCVPDYPSHPLKIFLEKGIRATINTDDPGISGIDLPYEYNVAAPKAGLTGALIRQAQVNALDAAFLTKDERRSLMDQKAADMTCGEAYREAEKKNKVARCEGATKLDLNEIPELYDRKDS